MKQMFKNIVAYIAPMLISAVSYGQTNITHAEYFFDSDPGFGSGTAITITTPAANVASLVFNANVASLANGVHTLYVRSKDANGKWSTTNKAYIAKVQSVNANPNSISNITKAEYFYDVDPGFGNGVNIPITAASNISSLVFSADVSAIATGVHTLYVRTKDATGWSVANKIVFAKAQMVQSNPNSISNIVKAEYFYNTDPGFGNGADIPLTAATNINGFIANADVSALPTGLHTLYIRTKDAQGKWSITSRLQFSKIQGVSSNPHQLSSINKAEYFYDADPGFGNGTDIPIVPSSNIASFTFNANVTVLANGMHTVYVRTRDSLGQWSQANKFHFVKVQPLFTNPHSISNIVKMEYYYDNDPGFGAGVDVPVTAGNDIASMNFNANVNTLPNGVHTLYVRTKDVQGKWSMANRTMFAKVQSLFTNPHSKSNITRIEYFVDTDPGFGNALPLTFTQDTNVNSVAFNVDMTVLVNGAHKLYIRSKDAQGNWSITNMHEFNGGTAPLSIKLLSFEAKLQQGKTVMLEWITEQEKDVARYIIERSYDASKWKYLGEKIPVSSTSNEKRTYQLQDVQPGTGIVYYRLTEIDVNGRKTQAPIRFVKIIDSETSIATVYPNPNDGKRVNISSSIFADGKVTITILAADGKIHLVQEVNDTNISMFTIANLHLAAGNYYINLQGKTKTESLKLQVTGNHF